MFEIFSISGVETTSWTTPAFIAIGVACFGWLVLCYSKLTKLRSEIDVAFEKIDVHIKERHHLAPSLIEIVKLHTTAAPAASRLIDKVVHARHTMATAAERVRAFSNDTSSINSLVNADVAFNLALENLTALQSTHNSLSSDELFNKLIKKLNSIDSNISFTHQLYNDAVNSYNNACASFPSLLLAGALGFRTAGILVPNRPSSATKRSLSQA